MIVRSEFPRIPTIIPGIDDWCSISIDSELILLGDQLNVIGVLVSDQRSTRILTQCNVGIIMSRELKLSTLRDG